MAFQLPSLPSFQTNIPQMPDPMQKYGQMLQLKSLLGQQELQPLQVQEAQEKVKQSKIATEMQQAEQQSQKAMMKAWSDPKFLDNFTGTDAAKESGLGFDPNAMVRSLVTQGVTPKDALALSNQFVERSQKIATTQKDVAQTGEANALRREKGWKSLADRIGGVLDAPTSKAGDMLAKLKQDLLHNKEAFSGVPQDDLAHVFSADLEHLPAMATMVGLDGKIADFHKSKAEAAKAQQGVIPEGGGLSPDTQQQIAKDVAIATNPQVQKGKADLARTEAQARQQAAQGDPNTAGQLLANGSLTLADLKTRGSTPDFIEKATLAAQKISPTYNPADEIIAEHVAKSAGANQFFGSANSLIAKGGTLDQLTELGKQIPQHDFPVLNTIDDWQNAARGKGPLAGYAAMALGVADDYGKVMGGGTASDHARDAALTLFSKAASPEQREQAIKATRGAVLSQRDSRIGKNQFLKRQYGEEVGGRKSLPASAIEKAAKDNGVSIDEAKRQAKAAGYDVE